MFWLLHPGASRKESCFLRRAEALVAGLSAARANEVIEAELGERAARRAAALAVAGCRRLLVVASGVDEVTASELALKIEEAVHLPSTPLGAEKVLHGHLPAADGHTGLVLLRFDPSDAERRDARAKRVGAACDAALRVAGGVDATVDDR